CLEQGDYAEAQTHLQKALALAGEMGQKVAQAEALYHLGRIAIEQNHLDEAQQQLEQAQALFTETADARGMARTLYLLADVEYYRRNYLEADLLARQALSMQSEKEDAYGRIQTLRLLADIALHGQNDLPKSKGYLERAINLSHHQQNEGELAVGLYASAEIFRQQGHLDEALAQAQQALILLVKMGDRKSQSQVLYRVSLIQADRSEYSNALSAGLESLELCRQLNDTQGMIYVLAHLGEVSKNLGYAERAQETWRKALALANEIQHPMVAWLQERLG
ncbi:MAG: tetratricopeptide repeat protein, partial [Anaerolineae bacterium]